MSRFIKPRYCRLLLSALIVLSGVGGFAQLRSIDQFFREFSDEWVRTNPDLAIRTRYFEGEQQDQLDRQMTPLTEAWRNNRVALARRGLTELQKFDLTGLPGSERLSARVLQWQLQIVVDGARHLDYGFPLQQFNGANVVLVDALTVQHPLATPRDAENYVERLGQVASRMREATEDAQRLARAGMMPPKFIVASTIRQMEQFISTRPEENPFVTTFVERTSGVLLPEQRRAALTSEAKRRTEVMVYPAWRAGIALLKEIGTRATDEAGLWRFKGGDDAYRHSLRQFTTTDLSPDVIHEIGLREVARIEQQMDAILKQMRRSEGSIAERIAALRTEMAYPKTEEGRRQIMQDITDMIRDAERRAAPQFDRRPKAPVIAEAYPAFQEATAAAGYVAAPTDGSRLALFRIPLRAERMTQFGLRTLVYHETVPGHHFQVGLEVEDDTQPKFRRASVFGTISALTEGWGLYAERLAAESGWYEGDLPGHLGQLQGELNRAKRLVVDTGLHAKRWTRQQAIDYGVPAAEVERYVVYPGQACAYMIGQLKILELREKARKALGEQFTERKFHNAVLSAGIVPLPVLEQEIDRYIQETTR